MAGAINVLFEREGPLVLASGSRGATTLVVADDRMPSEREGSLVQAIGSRGAADLVVDDGRRERQPFLGQTREDGRLSLLKGGFREAERVWSRMLLACRQGDGKMRVDVRVGVTRVAPEVSAAYDSFTI
jgi:hypothetical protein